MSSESDLIRRRYKYRRLILSGKLKLPYKDAAKLLGPDCAYHLYGFQPGKKDKPGDRTDSDKNKSSK